MTDFAESFKSDKVKIKLNAVITETETGEYFGFLTEYSLVCAQGKSKKDVKRKLKKHFNIFINEMLHGFKKNNDIKIDNSKVIKSNPIIKKHT